MAEIEILKPCPICGKEIEVVCIGGGWFWRHKDNPSNSICCISHSQKYSSREEAIKEINKRSSDTLISQLQAENERLKGDLKTTMRNYVEGGKIIKAEAYKKFAELLFEKAERRNHKTEEYHYVLADDIVDLLKELVGEETPTNDVKCIECEYLMFSDCYGECSKAYKGIVSPDDSCGKGKKKEGKK